ncbi:MAG: hypothetical protein KIT56_11125, partial [Gammaproteobacteria bacterium]|nr:hypothetical protein [Gammaproteobacteria bacterium]
MTYLMDEIALNLSPGSKVIFQGEQYVIKLPLGLDTVLIEKISDRVQQHAKISELLPLHSDNAQS